MTQAIITKYLGPTDTRGARIKVKSWIGDKTYSYDHASECAHESAFADWLKEANDKMAKKYGSESPLGGWYKLVAKGNNPDGSGYTFIIK